MLRKRDKGPVETLCDEIGFRFERSMETEAVLVSFVGVLVDEIADMRGLRVQLSAIGCVAPSDHSGDVLQAARDMLTAADKVVAAAAIHDISHQPDDGPCDHLVDMLSSCASAIRFGLEVPCMSRHAASAADHIWKHVYGVSRFDSFTSNWRNDWTRAQLQKAILRLVPAHI